MSCRRCEELDSGAALQSDRFTIVLGVSVRSVTLVWLFKHSDPRLFHQPLHTNVNRGARNPIATGW